MFTSWRICRYIFLAVAFFPIVAHAASFDCSRARSVLEILICADPELSSLDGQVGQAYTKLHSTFAPSSEQGLQLLSTQRDFLKERTAVCNIPFTQQLSNDETSRIITCLKGNYTLRLNTLQKQLAAIEQQNAPTPVANTTAVNTPAIIPSQTQPAANDLTNSTEIIPAIEGTWKVTGVVFPGISAIGDEEAKPYIGKELQLYKGSLTSPFGNCDACGLNMTYVKHTVQELTTEDPKTYSGLKFPNSYVIEHTLSWGKGESLSLLQIDNQNAYVEKDGAFFTLQKEPAGAEQQNAPTSVADTAATNTPANAPSQVLPETNNTALPSVAPQNQRVNDISAVTQPENTPPTQSTPNALSKEKTTPAPVTPQNTSDISDSHIRTNVILTLISTAVVLFLSAVCYGLWRLLRNNIRQHKLRYGISLIAIVIIATVLSSHQKKAEETVSTERTASPVAKKPDATIVWVLGNTAQGQKVVEKFDSNGKYLGTLGMKGDQGDGHFGAGLAIDSKGNIWIFDSGNLIQKFDSDGNYLLKLGSWGTGNGQFKEIGGIAIDSHDNLWATDNLNARVEKFDNMGRYLGEFRPASVFHGRFSIAIDKTDNIWITNQDQSIVQKFDSNGNYLEQFGSVGDGNGQFKSVGAVAIDSNGNAWVADDDRIEKFDSNGNYLDQLGSGGPLANSGLVYPSNIAIDSNNNIWVALSLNKRVEKFDSNGKYLLQFGSSGPIAIGHASSALDTIPDGIKQLAATSNKKSVIQPSIFLIDGDRIERFTLNGQYISQFQVSGGPVSISVDVNNNIWVLEWRANRVEKFDSEGNNLGQFGFVGSAEGQFKTPFGIATDKNGDVFVLDTGNNRIQKFDNVGKYLLQFGTAGSGDGQFHEPQGITIDSNDNIWVSDFNNNRVQKFDNNGKYLLQIGNEGKGDGQFAAPTLITVDTKNNVWVVDSLNNRVEEFDNNGKYIKQFFIGTPTGLALDASENLLITQKGYETLVAVLNKDGKYVGRIGSNGTGHGQFTNPHSIITNIKNYLSGN